MLVRGVLALVGLLWLAACVPDAANAPPGTASAASTTHSGASLRAFLQSVEFDPTADNGGATAGMRVEVVGPGGPADIAGLKEGDIITSINGMPVRTHPEIGAALGRIAIGSVMSVSYLRGGKRQEAAMNAVVPKPAASWVGETLDQRLAAAEQNARDAEADGKPALALQDEVKAYRVETLRASSGTAKLDAVEAHIHEIVARLATLVAKLQSSPTIPAEALRHNRRAIALVNAAGSDDDNQRAYKEFEAALYEAPWIADLWLNAGLVLARGPSAAAAKGFLQNYLILNPQAADAASVRQRMAELELLEDELKPWRPFVGTIAFKNPDGSPWQESVGILGHTLTVKFVNGAIAGATNNPGDVILSGTLSGRRFSGKLIWRPTNEALIRCFSRQYEQDAQGEIEADGSFVIRAKYHHFDPSSCLRSPEDLWIAIRTYHPNPYAAK